MDDRSALFRIFWNNSLHKFKSLSDIAQALEVVYKEGVGMLRGYAVGSLEWYGKEWHKLLPDNEIIRDMFP